MPRPALALALQGGATLALAISYPLNVALGYYALRGNCYTPGAYGHGSLTDYVLEIRVIKDIGESKHLKPVAFSLRFGDFADR